MNKNIIKLVMDALNGTPTVSTAKVADEVDCDDYMYCPKCGQRLDLTEV